MTKNIVRGLQLVGACLLVLAGKTCCDLRPITALFAAVVKDRPHTRMVDRHGTPLAVSYQSEWNNFDTAALHEFPDFLTRTLVFSEDKQFYRHGGVDWRAKLAATWQNLKARRYVRGASTLTEQVVHMLTKRPRTLWSKYLEAIEAHLLEARYSKNHILEFYLNQVPFAANRRGMLQAALYYFNRDLSTLTRSEMLALVVLIKAPSAYDLWKSQDPVKKNVRQLVARLQQQGLISPAEAAACSPEEGFALQPSPPLVNAYHFLSHLRNFYADKLLRYPGQRVATSLDASLQSYAQGLLDQRLAHLRARHVTNGAALVVNHHSGEILAWVVGGASADAKAGLPGGMINAVTTRRQPGSALKPFVYAMAMEKGWQATTLIDDAQLKGSVGQGLHKFRNYSNTYYGPVTLREALANSLNVPAVKALRFVGPQAFLDRLRQLGFASLQREAVVYDEGLALGNGEVNLLELVHAYTTLAQQGTKRPLQFFLHERRAQQAQPVFAPGIATIIGDILSDAWARRYEFGSSGILNTPVQTAIKTGTSTAYRDAWIVGYDHQHVVGLWMGNLDNSPMEGITGAIGPALTLRALFAYLNRQIPVRGLPGSSELTQKPICLASGPDQTCRWHSELFHSYAAEPSILAATEDSIKIVTPTPGLKMAVDPRIPLDKQKFEFRLATLPAGHQVEWWVDDEALSRSEEATYLWPLQKGQHNVRALVVPKDSQAIATAPARPSQLIRFTVN